MCVSECEREYVLFVGLCLLATCLRESQIPISLLECEQRILLVIPNLFNTHSV